MAQQQSGDAKRRPATTSPRALYLTIYNLAFASLWCSVLFTTLGAVPTGKLGVFNATFTRARWIQTASLIEVLHAATGTRASQSEQFAANKFRHHQVSCQHHSSASCHTRYSSLDGVVLLPCQHSIVLRLHCVGDRVECGG